MEILITIILAILMLVGGLAILTALINMILLALGLSAVSWWVVLLVIIVLRLIKWFIS